MSGEIIKEWYFWLASIGTGICMAFSYDIIRLFRRLIRHGRIAVDLEDVLYWTACFVFSFTLLYYGNNGVIRFAAVIGAAIGMGIYAVTLGRFFVKTCYWLIDKTLGSAFRAIAKIVRNLHNLLTPVTHQIKNFLIGKYRLTRVAFEHKIKVRRKSRKGKGETAYGISKAKKRKVKAKKNAGVSPRQK